MGLYYQHPLGHFIAWFLFFGMFLGEPTYPLVFPNLEGGRYHYFPGMWTALLPTGIGVWGINAIVQEYKLAWTTIAVVNNNSPARIGPPPDWKRIGGRAVPPSS